MDSGKRSRMDAFEKTEGERVTEVVSGEAPYTSLDYSSDTSAGHCDMLRRLAVHTRNSGTDDGWKGA